MTPEPSIIRRARKLAVLAERGVGGERETAALLYQALLDRYDLDPASLERESEHVLECPRTHNRIVAAIATHLGMTAFRGDIDVLFTCSDAAFELVRTLYTHSVELVEQRRREQWAEIRSDIEAWIGILEQRPWQGDVGGLERRRQFKCPRGLRAFVRALADHVGARLPKSRAAKSVVMFITDCQYAALRALYAPVALRVAERVRRLPGVLEGFIAGHLDAAYPASLDRIPCAGCGERALVGNEVSGSVHCTRCGYRYPAPKRRTVDGRGYEEGQRRSRRALCEPVGTDN